MEKSKMWRDTLNNLGLSLLVYAVLLAVLWLVELFWHGSDLIRFYDMAWCVGIPASVAGVGYVLTIRDVDNYMGFYLGVLMSLLLAVQFFLQGNYDLTLLYVLVFVPFQVKSIINWRAGAESGRVMFLSSKERWLSVLVFVVIIIGDWLLATYVINGDRLSDGVWLKLFGSVMIASSVLANFWLIYKKTDAWLYWVLYSVSGICFYVVLGNAFSIVLFSFFLVINSMAGVAWLRMSRM